MRKLTILLALAAITASSGCSNCCCLGRVRNWFHKGSPCGTTVAPAVLGAPLAMGTPLAQPVSAPVQPMFASPTMAPQMYVEQPGAVCCPCVPCDPCVDPCADPCSGAVSMGYMGGYTSEACCGDGTVMAPATMAPMTTTPMAPGQVVPQPMAE